MRGVQNTTSAASLHVLGTVAGCTVDSITPCMPATGLHPRLCGAADTRSRPCIRGRPAAREGVQSVPQGPTRCPAVRHVCSKPSPMSHATKDIRIVVASSCLIRSPHHRARCRYECYYGLHNQRSLQPSTGSSGSDLCLRTMRTCTRRSWCVSGHTVILAAHTISASKPRDVAMSWLMLGSSSIPVQSWWNDEA